MKAPPLKISALLKRLVLYDISTAGLRFLLYSLEYTYTQIIPSQLVPLQTYSPQIVFIDIPHLFSLGSWLIHISGFNKLQSDKDSCCSVMSDSLWSYGLQHTRLPRPSLSPRACSNSCPLSRWCHPTILSSVAPFSSCLQSFPASGSFLKTWLFASDEQNIGASASASVFPMNIQGWLPFGLISLISLLPKGLSRVFCSTTVQKHILVFVLEPTTSEKYHCFGLLMTVLDRECCLPFQ